MAAESTGIHKARLITIALSVVGLVLSYISLDQHVLYSHGFAAGPSFCHINAHLNCEAVNTSEWSMFFGLPVASYGLLLYCVLLIGSLAASSSGRILELKTWSAVTLLVSCVASLLSVVLFGISEFLIGALCLMCLGTYIVNFLILGVVWRSLFRGRFVQGIRAGVCESARLIGVVLGIAKAPESVRPWRLRVLSLLVVLSGFASAVLPDVLFQVYAAQEMVEGDPVEGWMMSPSTTFNLEVGKGAFGDYSRGDPSAPIQIVEFADYECPACKRMHELMQELLERYQGKYHFVFKNYPLDKSCNPEMKEDLHEFACVAALYSRCAGEQGKFWEANTVLFLRDADKGELKRESLLADGSKELGLDEVAVRECMESGRYREAILNDIKAGTAAGLQGTPSVWVNGKLVTQPSLEAFARIFDTILKERGIPRPNIGERQEPRD
ncbi:MAG: hypothetical protein RL518_1506 [Pseudomonadota bacterium]|jgi:protein-disulfide isomerase/uncharacterized membrane protein